MAKDNDLDATTKKKVAKKKAAKPSRTSFAENVEKRMGY